MSAPKRPKLTGATKEKKFVMYHIFTDVLKLKKGKKYKGETMKNFNIDWHISIKFEGDDFWAYLDCPKIINNNKSYNIVTEIKPFFLNNTKILAHITRIWTFSPTRNYRPLVCLESTHLEDYLINGNFAIEFEVTIKEMTGIEEPPVLKHFDESNKEFSDVVLVVEGQRFYVNKSFLAGHATYFKSLFYGNSNESKQSEVELKDIDPEDFQNYLELIYGESLVDDDTVEGILHLAGFFDSKTAVRRCEEFLLNHSKKSPKKKLELASKYKLGKLMEKCFSDIKTLDDIRAIVPKDIHQLDHKVSNELLEKSLALRN